MFGSEKGPRPTPSLLQRMLIMGILLAAAWLRWMMPGLVEFKYDEAHIFGMAQGIASGQYWPVLSGGTSIGLPRSALDAYILAIPLSFTDGSPQAVVIWLGMLGVMAVALGYLLGRMIEGRWTGILVAAYMAFNPWLVFYDRKFWAHIQVVFSVLLLLLAWRVVMRNSRAARFWFPVVAAFQLLTHVLALVQILSWLGAVVIAPKRWWRKETLWGAMAGLVVMTPYLMALGKRLFDTGMKAALELGGAVAGQGEATGGQAFLERWRLAWQLFGGDRVFELTGAGQRITAWDTYLGWVSWLVLALMMVGLIRVVGWLRQPERRRGASLLLAWTLGPVLALSLGPLEVYLQYWTVMLPLPAIFFALGVTWLASLLPSSHHEPGEEESARPVGWGVVGMMIGIVVIMGLMWDGEWSSVMARVDEGAGFATFGRPLRDWQEATAQADFWAQKLGLNQVKVLARGVDPGQDGEPAAIASLIGNPPYARFLDLDGPTPGLLLHAEQPSLYLTTTDDMEAILAGLGKQVWQGGGPVPMRLYLLPSASDSNIPAQWLSEDMAFDVGATLIGFAFPDPWPEKEPVQVMLIWRMDAPTQEARQGDYTAFNHIVRMKTDAKVAQVDGIAMLSRDWWPDDVLYQFYTVTIPEAGDFEWLAGLYSRRNGARAHLHSGEDSVAIPIRVDD